MSESSFDDLVDLGFSHESGNLQTSEQEKADTCTEISEDISRDDKLPDLEARQRLLKRPVRPDGSISEDANHSLLSNGLIFLPEDNQAPWGCEPERISVSDDKEEELIRTIIKSNVSLIDILRAGVEALTSGSYVAPMLLTAEQSALIGCQEVTPNSWDVVSGDPQSTDFPLPSLPDMRRNHIRINRLSFVAACLANAPLIGVAPERACGPNSISPFYCPNLPSDSVEILQRTFSSLKQDLRPCQSQISVNHRVYLDLLPFPDFRERVLGLISHLPMLFIEAELCKDLDNDGMICWGSGIDFGSGTPWDKRSWEINPWFLRKWWMLTGGVDGEMYSQSRWWCEMQGQRFVCEESSFHAPGMV